MRLSMAARSGKRSPKLERAIQLIRKELPPGQWVSSNELHGKLRMHLSECMFGRVKSELGIKHRRVKGTDGKMRYEWYLPPDR